MFNPKRGDFKKAWKREETLNQLWLQIIWLMIISLQTILYHLSDQGNPRSHWRALNREGSWSYLSFRKIVLTATQENVLGLGSSWSWAEGTLTSICQVIHCCVLSSLWHWVLWESRQQEPCSPGTHSSMEETNQVRLHIHRGHSNLPSGEKLGEWGGGEDVSPTLLTLSVVKGWNFFQFSLHQYVVLKAMICALTHTWDPPLELVNTWVFYSILGDQSIPWPCCSNVKLQPKFLNLYFQWPTTREEYETEADLKEVSMLERLAMGWSDLAAAAAAAMEHKRCQDKQGGGFERIQTQVRGVMRLVVSISSFKST